MKINQMLVAGVSQVLLKHKKINKNKRIVGVEIIQNNPILEIKLREEIMVEAEVGELQIMIIKKINHGVKIIMIKMIIKDKIEDLIIIEEMVVLEVNGLIIIMEKIIRKEVDQIINGVIKMKQEQEVLGVVRTITVKIMKIYNRERVV